MNLRGMGLKDTKVDVKTLSLKMWTPTGVGPPKRKKRKRELKKGRA